MLMKISTANQICITIMSKVRCTEKKMQIYKYRFNLRKWGDNSNVLKLLA